MTKPVVQFKPKASEPAPTVPAKKPRRRAWASLARASVIVAGIGLAVVIPLGWGGWVAGMTDQRTDNAYLHADMTPVSAEVEGRVTRLLVSDYQQVKKGDLLMQIDPSSYRAQVRQAEAGVLAARAQIENIRSQINLQRRVIDRAGRGWRRWRPTANVLRPRTGGRSRLRKTAGPRTRSLRRRLPTQSVSRRRSWKNRPRSRPNASA